MTLDLQAEPLYKRAPSIREKSLGPDRLTARITWDNLTGLRVAIDRLATDDKAEYRMARF